MAKDIMEEIQKLLAEGARQSLEFKKGMSELRESQKETDKQMKEVQKELGGIGNSQEEVGIDLFRRNMKKTLARRGIKVDSVTTRFKNAVKLDNGELLQGEYDLMGINGKDIVVVEVKNKLKQDHIEKFLKKQLPRFKTIFPQFKDYNLYGGVGSLIVGEHQEKLAEKNGLFVFTQGEDGNAMIMNDENFKAKIF